MGHRALALVLAAVLVAAYSRADDAQGEPKPAPTPSTVQPSDSVLPFFLGEVVVSGGEDEEPPPGTTDSLDPQAIEATSAVTVAEALQWLPGVSMSTGARNEQKIWVRGYQQSDVLVLVDGIPMSDPYYGELDLGQLPVFDVASISVTRGAASPLYGTNGLGGVINVVTLQGGSTPGVSGRFRLTDNRTYLAHASTGGSAGTINWYVGAGLESSDGWDLSNDFEATPFQDRGRRVNSDFERASLLTRIGWRPDSRSTLYASIRLIDAEKGIPFHTTEPAGFVKFSRFPEWRQATVGLGYERRFSSGAELRGQLYGMGFENTLDVFADPELETIQLESTFSDRVYGGYVIGQWQPGSANWLSASLHFRQDRHSKTERYPDGSTDPNERYLARTSSVAVEDRWRIGVRTSLVGSLAAEWLRVEEARTLRPMGASEDLVDDPLTGDTLVSPQLELRTDLGQNWSASAAVYRRGQFPTMRQLYGTHPPNPALRPQQTTGIDLGVEWTGPRMTVRGNLFTDHVQDFISRQDRFEPYQNQDEAEIRGLELRLDGATNRLEYDLSWTALDHRFTRSSEGLKEIPYVPRHQAEIRAEVHVSQRIDLRGDWLVTGGRVDYNRGEKRDLDGYHLIGLGVAGRLNHVELSIHLDNLLDADVDQEEGFPLPGRRLWAGVRFNVDL